MIPLLTRRRRKTGRKKGRKKDRKEGSKEEEGKKDSYSGKCQPVFIDLYELENSVKEKKTKTDIIVFCNPQSLGLVGVVTGRGWIVNHYSYICVLPHPS